MVGLGSSNLILSAIPKQDFRLTPPPPEPTRNSALGDLLIGIFGSIASALSGGIIAPLLIGVAEASLITVNDYSATGSVNLFNTLSAGLGVVAGEINIIKGVALADKTSAVAARVDEVLVQEGASSLERDVFQKSVEGIVTKQIGAEGVATNLVKAGLTEEQVTLKLRELSNILKEEGVKAARFQDEVSFVLQETNIFERVVKPLEAVGINSNVMFEALRSGGIDVVGIKETEDLVKAFRSSSVAFKDIQEAGIIKELEDILERDIEPTVFTRILNAQKLERSVVKINKLTSLINPNTLIGEVANKIFDPLKSKVESKILTPLKKKATQKIKHLLRQDVIRKQATKNGVYPCFASSAINYLRAVPMGNGKYKCFVIWRKWGYQPTLITPLLELQFIINWSESTSPGRIYSDFRRKYGKARGVKDTSVDGANAAYQIFNLLGFIPDKYISLGVSLIGNITTATSVISQDLWGDFARNEAKYLEQPIRDKVLEIGGGEFAKAVANQASGDKGAVNAYFEGKIKEAAEAKEGAFRKSGREGKGKVDAVLGMSSVIK